MINSFSSSYIGPGFPWDVQEFENKNQKDSQS